MNSPSSPPWYREIASRIWRLWPLKAIGTMAFMGLFFYAYFAVLRHPLGVPTIMPLTFIDRLIPFTPAAFAVYASLWVYVSLPPALLGGLRSLLLFGLWIAAMCLFCLGLFWLWPTSVPPAGIDWADYPGMAVLKGIDAAGNACPSLHVASAVFSALWFDRVFARIRAPQVLRWASGIFCLAILWSTMATRQHVALDVLAGTAVGVIFGLLSLRQVAGQADDQFI